VDKKEGREQKIKFKDLNLSGWKHFTQNIALRDLIHLHGKALPRAARHAERVIHVFGTAIKRGNKRRALRPCN
jgi:hypothetical protein